eukprot:TRINITY_DN32381_c0_g1_i1.p1 TRINITY_DN32381_c0_g1~~TRINITY_DN32381_c0_g1_i1.p1  ORF type:complete len:814 (-),score=117.79 TRINITY_DN32381_c0_g1_i1:200-2641(-)
MTALCLNNVEEGDKDQPWRTVVQIPEKEPPKLDSARRVSMESCEDSAAPDGNGKAKRETTRRRDTFKSLSIEEQEDAHNDHHAMPSMPIALLVFVCLLASIAGAIAAGFHLLTLYTGCPLEINSCDKKHGFYNNPVSLIKASVDVLPKELVYILVGTVTHFLMGIIFTFIDEESAWQCVGGGTMQSLVAVASGYPIPMRSAAFRIVICALYFCGGGTLGGEGPAIHICTAMATSIGWFCGIQAPRTQSLLGSLGFCCGFSSSFNAPLTGILFAMEELQHVYSGSAEQSQVEVWMFLLSSVSAVLVRRAFKGNKPMIKVNISNDDGLLGEYLWMLIAIPIGVVCALIGFATNRFFSLWHRKVVQRLKERIPTVILFPVFGAAVASLGALVYSATGLPGIWGIGIESLQKVFDKELRWHDYIVFAIGKLFAMVLSITMGFPGDMLEPVLIAGGFIGGFFGSMLPQDVVGEEALPTCAILGMVALFSSCFRFPLTSVVIVIELTGIRTYSVIVPTALASFTALIASNKLSFDPLLEQLLSHTGIDLSAMAKLAAQTDCQEVMEDDDYKTGRGGAGIANNEVSTISEEDSDDDNVDNDPRDDSKSPSHRSNQGLGRIFSPLAQSLAHVSSPRGSRRISSLSQLNELSLLLHSANGPLSHVAQSGGSDSSDSRRSSTASSRLSVTHSTQGSAMSRRMSVASNFSEALHASRRQSVASVMSHVSHVSSVERNPSKDIGLLGLPAMSRVSSGSHGVISGNRIGNGAGSSGGAGNLQVEAMSPGINIISEEAEEEDEGPPETMARPVAIIPVPADNNHHLK